MIRSSREIIHDLIGYGVDFQKQETDESGNEAADNGGEKVEIQDIYAFTREGAHSRPREFCFMQILQEKKSQVNCLHR